MEAILHLGCPKAGSSSLQKSLRSAKPFLKQNKILYSPDHLLNANIYTVMLKNQRKTIHPSKVLGGFFQNDYNNAVRQNQIEKDLFKLKKFDYFLMSSEHLLYTDPEDFMTFIPENIGFHAVVYIRHPKDSYISQVQQEFHYHGSVISPAYYCFNGFKKLNQWASHPRCLSLTVKKYDKNVSIVPDFELYLKSITNKRIQLKDYRINESIKAEHMIVLQEYWLYDDFHISYKKKYKKANQIFEYFRNHNKGTRPQINKKVKDTLMYFNKKHLKELNHHFPWLDLEVDNGKKYENWNWYNIREILEDYDENIVKYFKDEIKKEEIFKEVNLEY